MRLVGHNNREKKIWTLDKDNNLQSLFNIILNNYNVDLGLCNDLVKGIPFTTTKEIKIFKFKNYTNKVLNTITENLEWYFECVIDDFCKIHIIEKMEKRNEIIRDDETGIFNQAMELKVENVAGRLSKKLIRKYIRFIWKNGFNLIRVLPILHLLGYWYNSVNFQNESEVTKRDLENLATEICKWVTSDIGIITNELMYLRELKNIRQNTKVNSLGDEDDEEVELHKSLNEEFKNSAYIESVLDEHYEYVGPGDVIDEEFIEKLLEFVGIKTLVPIKIEIKNNELIAYMAEVTFK